MRRSLGTCLVVLAVSCGAPVRPPPPAAAGPIEPAPAPRDDGRLGDAVRPTAYTIDLDVDPNKPRFSGSVQIAIDVARASRFVVLHARGPRIRRAEVEVAVGPRRAAKLESRKSHGSKIDDELVVGFDAPLPVGKAVLHFEYDAPFDPELAGLYRVQEGGRWYAFTQFESTYARRTFPAFDEPGSKTPFTLTVRVPKGMAAFSNTNEARRRDEGSATVFSFETTAPLPTYLLALAVGDLEVTTGESAGKTPIRAITTRGKSGRTKEALSAAKASLGALEEYFGIPYPYGKLDVVAVPDFGSGAMENVGLVTFREELMLVDDARGSERAKRSLWYVMAHELAHQWFGDLVTAAWWDDLWLNEGFATWMERIVLRATKPEWKVDLDAVLDAHSAMDTDSLVSARAIRQPVTSAEEAGEAFDTITYEKGAAVLGMLESALGKEAFRSGVQNYLSANAHRAARSETFFDALAKTSGKDVKAIATPFFDRRGVPLLDWVLTCDAMSGAQMSMGVQRWLPLGSAERKDDAPWAELPVCVRDPKSKEPWCGTPVPKSFPSCPAWVAPNAGERGYYRYLIEDKTLRDLTTHRSELDPASRIGVVLGAWANVRSGALPLASLVRELPRWDSETERHVLVALTIVLGEIREALYEATASENFSRFVAERVAAYERTLTKMSPRDQRLFSQRLAETEVDLAKDERARAKARTIADAWLAAPKSADTDEAEAWVVLASRGGDAFRWAKTAALLEQDLPPDARILTLRALSGFDQKDLVEKTLSLLLGPSVKLQDTRYVLGPLLGRAESRGAAVAWIVAHWDELRTKLPGGQAARLVAILGATCTSEDHDKVKSFLEPRTAGLEGVARRFAEEDERSVLCRSLRDKLGDPFTTPPPPTKAAASKPQKR